MTVTEICSPPSSTATRVPAWGVAVEVGHTKHLALTAQAAPSRSGGVRGESASGQIYNNDLIYVFGGR